MRPDILEVFGGSAEVSLQFARRGLNVIEPCDKLYGSDLRDSNERAKLVEFVESKRPRLLVVSWPCTYWSPLCNINYRTNREKQQLRRLRDMEKPFSDLTEKLCNVQLKHGDDILGEKPLPSAAFREPQLERIYIKVIPKFIMWLVMGVGTACGIPRIVSC